MEVLKQIFKSNSLSHAYLLRTDNEDASGILVNELTENKYTNLGSPDLYQVSYESLGIDEARKISQYASLKPIGERKYIIVTAERITTEAQSALLKNVEEGAGHSVFFFIIKPGVSVLPTLQSRCVVLKDSEESSERVELGKEFLKLDYKDRLKKAEKFAKDSDREGARELVRSLLSLSDNKKFDKKKLRDLLEADKYLQLSGSSPKGVIGHLALTL